MNTKKKWKNLFKNECPKCNCPLVKDGAVLKCTLWSENKGAFDCDFIISLGTFAALKQKLRNQQDLEQFDHDNSAGLNNL